MSQSNHSLARWQAGTVENYPFSSSEQAQKMALPVDRNGGLWALSPLDGLFFFDRAANAFEKKLDIKNGQSLLIHEDYLLVGSESLHIYALRGDRLRLVRNLAFGEDLVTAIHVDQQGQFFVGTKKGKLLRFPDLDRSPQTIYGANEAHRVEELDFGPIHEIYVIPDSIGDNDMLWICAETGLWLLQQRFFKTVKNLPMNNPISIAMGELGKAWVPMSYLYEISPRGNAFTARPVLDNLRVNAVAQDKDGFIWVTRSTPRVELIKYAGERVVKTYDFHERGEAIFNLFPDSRGNLWFCQAPLNKPIVGVAQIDAQGEVKYYDSQKGFSSRVLAIKESSRGEIYAVGIGEDSYLYRYDPQKDRFVNLSPKLPFEALLNFEAHDLTIDVSSNCSRA